MSQAEFVVTGGTPLYGSVQVGGAKNASYKLMIAALLGSSQSRLLNLPDISDVDLVAAIIEELGGKAYRVGERTFFIDGRGINTGAVDQRHGEQSRASTLFLPPLLAKLGYAKVPLPGGDKIGKRPLERHMQGLEKMGVTFTQTAEALEARCAGLRGCHYRFEKNTHTGTETLITAAVLATGTTVLDNAAEEPEIDDLINFLNQMGARIKRSGARQITIEGVRELSGAIYKIMPDRNESVSYACAAIASRGDIVLENARASDLIAFLAKLDDIGAGYEIGDYGIRFFYKGPLRATEVTTSIHPGFMTDWQPLFATLLCQCEGESVLHETVMQNRFQYVEDLKKMGAKIEYFNPEVSDPETLYNFNWQDRSDSDRHAIRISGPTQFTGGEFTIHDLRAGATILLAAISAQGQTVLRNIGQIERGYQKIDEKLRLMGAQIERRSL